jgi:hypothetical protein
MASNMNGIMDWLTDKMTGDRFLSMISQGNIEVAISALDHQGYKYGDDPSIDSVFNSKIAVIQQWMKRSLDLSITDGIYAWRMIDDFDLPWDSVASWWTDNPVTKAQVVRPLLKLMHEGHYSDVLEIIDTELAYLDLGWKELAVIRKSAEHELDRNVLPDLLESDYDSDDRRRDMQYDDDGDAVDIDDEFVDLFRSYKRVDDIDTVLDIAAEKLGNNDRELDRLVRDNADQIVHWFEDNADRSSAKSILFFLTVFSEFCDVARWSTEFRDAIDHRREEFVKYLLPRFVTDNVPKSEVAVLSSIVDWPELDAMQRSISANQKSIKETIKLSDLDTASEKQQLSTVKKDWRKIKYITNPSEAVQLAAVQHNGNAIFHILHHKIVPSEAVQLAAVQQDGYVINYLISNSIVPSKAVQIAAIQQDGTMITKINRPTPGLFADADVKHSVIKTLLTDIQKTYYFKAEQLVKFLRRRNVEWPELDAIERSLNAIPLSSRTPWQQRIAAQDIDETNNEDDGDDEGPVVRMSSPDEQIVDRMYRRMREGSYMALYDAIADLEERRMPDHMIEEVLRPQADSIIRWLDRNIKSGMYQWKNVDQIWKLLEMGARWPALVRLLNDHKEIMMYHLLNDVKAGTSASIDLEDVLGHLDQLAEIGVDWKELEIIKRSVNKELDRIHGIDESLRVNQQAAVNTWYERFIENIKNNYHAELSWNLIMMGRLTAAVSVPMQTPVVNKHKHAIVKAMLEAISNLNPDAANSFNYSDREQKEMLVGARKLGVAWPELDIMERSVNANAAPKGSIA